MKCGIDLSIQTKNTSGNISVSGFGYQRSTEHGGFSNKAQSPSWICDKIKDLNILLLIDEFDSIQNKDDKHKVAELIKLLSDSNSSLKYL